jgi:hypothetical protein
VLRLEDIKRDSAVIGIEPGQIVQIVSTDPVGENALTVWHDWKQGFSFSWIPVSKNHGDY